ncbi:hypothetical protein [Aphanizomenon flos-aquae]|uniref:hypothetical protein n=1 Tax=Aphanizomenon flos-aquae TaxID=1176 RepID=UPI00168171B7|nr:hypothetical protein [Aphanizomenon flos-aquae]MBD2389813.1 hypothetical protein [Aphanizomenon flos-aquae FACHB-1171]MBD2557565.1 hypothetical protein [Aphanizomenon flos-aquae FACHB-1290]MBD2656046.1 hypothetical protein [Aphanizomenon flos-aquae FACHB-1265]MBD2695722.1 hypothetical protein [Aphanizomenon flos-aquae FACHB-1287]
MSPENNGGAKIEARSPKPCIDLVTLVELLTKAIPPKNNSGTTDKLHPDYRPAFAFDADKNRLRICTSAVMRRFFGNKDFKTAFDPEGGGFVQDLPTSGYGLRMRVGGTLKEDNRDRLPKALDQLILAIDAALPPETQLSALLLSEPEKRLQELAQKTQKLPQKTQKLPQETGAFFQNKVHNATLVPIAFPNQDNQNNPENKPIAKVISASETIDANNYFKRMSSAVKEHLENQGLEADDIEISLDALEAENTRLESQLNRFLTFLDDEALARVRLLITLRIMEAISKFSPNKHELLRRYVQRVKTFYDAAKEHIFEVDLSANFGIGGQFNLSESLQTANLYFCLPVWPESEAQIFEDKTINQEKTSFGVVREVSYHFRINGKNPTAGKFAFEARLDTIEKELELDNEDSFFDPIAVTRSLSQLIFLAVVVPSEIMESATVRNFSSSVQQLLKDLKNGGKNAVKQLIVKLQKCAKTMKTIASSLIDVINTKSEKIISQVQSESSQQFICVKRDIFEWSRLTTGASQNLLVGSENPGRETVAWFKNIEVCDTPETPGLLFSVKVNTQLSEHNLVTKGNPYSIQVQRILPKHLLQIIWCPFSFSQENDKWTYKASEDAPKAQGWSLPAAIVLEYDASDLTPKEKGKGSEENKQYHAAGIAAFEVLVYCCLWHIINKLKQEVNDDFTTLMLRLQEQGKESDDKDGDSYVYAAAQTLEAILAEDTNIRMQGIVLKNLDKENKNIQYVKKNIFNALLSAFPIVTSTPKPPTVPKIGLISYSTRPCDESINTDEKSYLFLTQSYIATAVNQPFSGYHIKAERTQSDIVDTPENLRKQRLVQEEIRYLENQGCEHIILLSHAYGSRRFNRVADYNAGLTPKEFLEDISQTFPDLTIYTLLRDVFPATRLYKREKNQAGFEILQAGDYTNFLSSVEKISTRRLIPVYTFATLYSIPGEQRPQSGFCVYFLMSDQRVSDFNWSERARQNLTVPEPNTSNIHPCLISVLRGLHFIEAEKGVQNGQFLPVLDPFPWISPKTVEAAGDVRILHSRRGGKVYLSYPALLTHVSQVLHRRK